MAIDSIIIQVLCRMFVVCRATIALSQFQFYVVRNGMPYYLVAWIVVHFETPCLSIVPFLIADFLLHGSISCMVGIFLLLSRITRNICALYGNHWPKLLTEPYSCISRTISNVHCYMLHPFPHTHTHIGISEKLNNFSFYLSCMYSYSPDQFQLFRQQIYK